MWRTDLTAIGCRECFDGPAAKLPRSTVPLSGSVQLGCRRTFLRPSQETCQVLNVGLRTDAMNAALRVDPSPMDIRQAPLHGAQSQHHEQMAERPQDPTCADRHCGCYTRVNPPIKLTKQRHLRYTDSIRHLPGVWCPICLCVYNEACFAGSLQHLVCWSCLLGRRAPTNLRTRCWYNELAKPRRPFRRSRSCP